MSTSTHKVRIAIPKRAQWPTYWLFQKEYRPGVYDLEIDDAQLFELKGDPVAVLAELDGKTVDGDAMPTPPQPPPVETKPAPKVLKTNR